MKQWSSLQRIVWYGSLEGLLLVIAYPMLGWFTIALLDPPLVKGLGFYVAGLDMSANYYIVIPLLLLIFLTTPAATHPMQHQRMLRIVFFLAMLTQFLLIKTLRHANNDLYTYEDRIGLLVIIALSLAYWNGKPPLNPADSQKLNSSVGSNISINR